MTTWKSPTDEPIRVALLSGHTVVVGPDPREVPDFFDEPLRAAGAFEVGAKAQKLRKRHQTTAEAANESETDGAQSVKMEDDDAL